MSSHGHYYGGPPTGSSGQSQSQSPFYAAQHPQQGTQYAPNTATSPVSSYSNSPPLPPQQQQQQQQQPPMRSHTAAPYSSGGYAPPPSAKSQGPPEGYYAQAPPSGPQNSSSGPYRAQQGGLRPDFSPPQQSTQPLPRTGYAPPQGAAGGYSQALPAIIANTHGLPPEVVQRLAEDLLRSIHLGGGADSIGGGGGAGVAQSGAPPLLPPHGQHPHHQRQGSPAVAQVPAPPPPQPPMLPQGHYGMPGTASGQFGGYGGPERDRERERDMERETAPAPGPPPPHHGTTKQQNQYGPPTGQSGYFPQQPPNMSPKGAGPAAMALREREREEGLGRKASHRSVKSGSAAAYAAAATSSSPVSAVKKTGMDDGAIFYELWGELVDLETGPSGEPRPKDKLVGLLRETANYMIKERPVKESIVITPEKMVDFYTCNAVEKEPLDWKAFFTSRSYPSLSSIYRALNCEHFYIPPASDQKPCIPALTLRGFETWMFTQLMSDPSRESQRLQKVVSNWNIVNTKTGHPFPKSIPRRCFPDKGDKIIADGWWRVWEEFPPDYSEESEEETLALPAPGSHRYPPQMTPPEGGVGMDGSFLPLSGPPHRGAANKKIPMTMPMSAYPPDDDSDDRRHSGSAGPPSKAKSKATPRKPDPHWRENELNPRPTLGDDGRANPPARPHTSHGHHQSVDNIEAPRSSRQRDRSEYGHRRHQSRHQSRHRRSDRDRSPSPDDGDWSASSGISARTPGSGDGPPLEAPVPPAPKREETRRFDAAGPGAGPAGQPPRGYVDVAYPDDFEEYQRHSRDRDRDDRRVAEYAYQDEFERDRRTSTAGPGSDGGRRSHHGGGRREGGGFYR